MCAERAHTHAHTSHGSGALRSRMRAHKVIASPRDVPHIFAEVAISSTFAPFRRTLMQLHTHNQNTKLIAHYSQATQVHSLHGPQRSTDRTAP